MFSTNLIQSNYGDLNIKSLAFDSFKERLQSTMTALTFFISTGQCDCDEIAESNFNYMIAYMSNINYDASKPGAPAHIAKRPNHRQQNADANYPA